LPGEPACSIVDAGWERRVKNWRLDAARALIPDVRERTRRAVEEVEALEARRDALRPGPERAELDGQIEREVQRWAREIEALGANVKGVWLVDFDSGAGYYCWQWPEESLEFFHTYEEGFAGRARIQ
jgi:hypothetical protein